MTTGKTPPDGGAAPLEGTVAEQLTTIDTSVLDQLLDLRKNEVRIDEFRARAEQMKGAVDPVVWQRVSDDYRSRLVAFAAQAGPLKGRAKLEYAKLRAVMDRLTIERRAAEVEKAELELRHAVGELSDEDLASKLTTSVDVLARCGEDDAAVAQLRTRFVEAFGDERALEAPVESPDATNMISPAELKQAGVAAPAAPSAPQAPAAPAPSAAPPAPPAAPPPAATTARTAVPTRSTLSAAAAPVEESPDATVLAMPAPAAPVAPADGGDDQTFLLPAAALLVNPGEPSPQEYRLAAINYLGRSDDNHLQIARPGVSRRHAVITAANSGFTIRDLSSQNGVFVNGARITEHALKDGEQIVIGDSTMLFRTPWPSAPRRDGKTRATRT